MTIHAYVSLSTHLCGGGLFYYFNYTCFPSDWTNMNTLFTYLVDYWWAHPTKKINYDQLKEMEPCLFLLTTSLLSQESGPRAPSGWSRIYEQALVSGMTQVSALLKDRITTTSSIMMNMMTIMIAIYYDYFYFSPICYWYTYMLIAMYNSLFIYVFMYEYNT